MGRDYLTGPSQNEGIAFMIPSQASSGFFFQRYGSNGLDESFYLDSNQLIEKFTTTTTTTTTTTSKTSTTEQSWADANMGSDTSLGQNRLLSQNYS